jgi:hypothetical protein
MKFRLSTCRPKTTRHAVIGVDRRSPGAPHMRVQKPAATTMARGDIPVVWPNNCGSTLAHDAFDDNKKQCGFRDHAPAGINCRGERERNGGGDKGPGVGDKPQHSADNAPEDRIGNADKAQSQPNDDSEGRVDSGQGQEVPAEPLRSVIEGLRGPVQIIRADETDESVAQIASLEQDEDHKNDDDRCRREWGQQGRENALHDLDRPRRRLVHFNQEWMIYRLRRLLLRGLLRGRVFTNVVLEPMQRVSRLLDHTGAEGRTPYGVQFLLITT